jgi:formylmethanofuran dehydrogenase subunit C
MVSRRRVAGPDRGLDPEGGTIVIQGDAAGLDRGLDLEGGTIVIQGDAAGLDRGLDLEGGTIVIQGDATRLDRDLDPEGGAIVIQGDAASLNASRDLETRVRNRLHVPHLPFLREHFPELQRVCQGRTVGKWLISPAGCDYPRAGGDD